MKIAITADSNNLEGNISDVFGRCPYIIILEINKNEVSKTEIIKNQGVDQTGGAGIACAQILAEKNIDQVITNNIGPRALDVLRQFKINVVNKRGKIKKIINSLINKK